MKLISYHNFKPKEPNKFLADEVGHWPILHGKSLRIFFFYIYWEKYSFWFRIFGYGISGKSSNNSWKMLFSERNGYIKYFQILNWKFKFLK